MITSISYYQLKSEVKKYKIFKIIALLLFIILSVFSFTFYNFIFENIIIFSISYLIYITLYIKYIIHYYMKYSSYYSENVKIIINYDDGNTYIDKGLNKKDYVFVKKV